MPKHTRKWLLIKTGPGPWTQTLKNLYLDSGLWTQTLKNLDPEKHRS